MHMGIDPSITSCNGDVNGYKCGPLLVLWIYGEELGVDVERDIDMYGTRLWKLIVILPWIWILRWMNVEEMDACSYSARTYSCGIISRSHEIIWAIDIKTCIVFCNWNARWDMYWYLYFSWWLSGDGRGYRGGSPLWLWTHIEEIGIDVDINVGM